MQRKKIIDVAEVEFDDNSNACNKFLVAVAKGLGVHLPEGRFANDLFDHMSASSEWLLLGKGHQAMSKAVEHALNGGFVVAATKENPNGHVAIIVGVTDDGTPIAYWGMLGGVGQKKGQLSYSWARSKFPNISYFAYNETSANVG